MFSNRTMKKLTFSLNLKAYNIKKKSKTFKSKLKRIQRVIYKKKSKVRYSLKRDRFKKGRIRNYNLEIN